MVPETEGNAGSGGGASDRSAAVHGPGAWFRLLAVPALILAAGLVLGMARGPFWGTHADPDYVYLTNALLIACGDKAYYADHPGSLQHLIHAAALTVSRRFFDPGQPPAGAVLARPERYLAVLNAIALVFCAGCAAAAGFLAGRWGWDTARVWLLQASPLLSMGCIRALDRITPEIWMTGLALAVAAVAGQCTWGSSDGKCTWRAAVCLGLLCGAGLASKITFLPVCVVALAVLAPGRLWGLYTLSCGTMFALLWANPLVYTRWYYLRFLGKLITHTEGYGHGAPGVFTASSLIAAVGAWSRVLLTVECLGVAVIALGCWLVWQRRAALFPRSTEPAAAGTRRVRLLAGLCAAQILQVIMALKSPSAFPRYLVPTFSLLGLNLVLAADLRGAPGTRSGRMQRRLLAGAALCIVAIQVSRLLLHAWTLHAVHQSRQAVREAATRQHPACPVVCYSVNSSQAAALYFGNVWARASFADELARLYPDFVFFDVSRGVLFDYRSSIDPAAYVSRHRRLLLQGEPRERLLESPWLSPVVLGEHEWVLTTAPGFAAQLRAAAGDGP